MENMRGGFPAKLYLDKRKFFPDPAAATLDGIVAMGDELRVEILLEAYSFGIFPWPHPDLPCLWFCPDSRGVLDFADLHISRSLDKFLRKTDLRVTYNHAFSQVITACSAAPRPGQTGTWITPPIEKVYNEFYASGYAHSVECWRGDDLRGGLYGVYVAGVFSAESMFFKESNASKLCFLKLVETLKSCGLTWIDIQMVTPVTAALGGKYIPKADFLNRLEVAKKTARPLRFS